MSDDYTPRRRVSTYRLEVQTLNGVEANTALDWIRAEMSTPLAGSGIGYNGRLSVLFRAADDDIARAQRDDIVLGCPKVILETVLSTGHGVNQRVLT